MADSETKVCQNCKSSFVIDASDFTFYEKIKVPPPTFCPECRLQRRMMFRNERNYYKRECDLCKRSIISVYAADVPFPVYCQKCWWSDAWDPTSYARDVDFSQPFFEQYKALADTVPRISIMNDDGAGSTNCEYAYDWSNSKNVYMSACGWYVENGLYLYIADYNKDATDCFWVNNSELMYESISCDRCHNCKYCTLCVNSHDCAFGYDLRGCSDCIMCVGLRNKRYCIRNVQYTKEEYAAKAKQMKLEYRSSRDILKKEFKEFVLAFPRKYAYNFKTVNSTGDLLIEVKSSRNCFYVLGPTENSRYVVINNRAKDCYDCNNTGNAELCYESITPDNSRGNKSSVFCWNCTEAEYSDNCHSCAGVFGCIGLKHASYAILNKKYSKSEFFSLSEKIIEHMKKNGQWGEFFPPAISPFAYNETAANEWFPLAREQALVRGYNWKTSQKREYKITKEGEDVPDTLAQVEDSFVDEIIACEHRGECGESCTEAFRIVPQELVFYRRMNIPLPTLCPNCRHYARLAQRSSLKLWHRTCQCAGEKSSNGVYANTGTHPSHEKGEPCPNEFETSYAPDRPEIVYCESCYNAEVA